MSELSKIANGVFSKFAKFVNEPMEIPDVSIIIPLAAGLPPGCEFPFCVIRAGFHQEKKLRVQKAKRCLHSLCKNVA